jgi:hypothetical protein
MLIIMKFGLWLSRCGLWLTKQGMTMAGMTPLLATEVQAGEPCVYIHRILDGPYHSNDYEDEWAGPEWSTACLIVKMENNMGVLEDVEWYFEDLDDAYVWVRHFNSSIDPIKVEGDYS